MVMSTTVPRPRCQRAGIMPICGHLQRRVYEAGRPSLAGAGEPQLAQAELQGGVVHHRRTAAPLFVSGIRPAVPQDDTHHREQNPAVPRWREAT